MNDVDNLGTNWLQSISTLSELAGTSAAESAVLLSPAWNDARDDGLTGQRLVNASVNGALQTYGQSNILKGGLRFNTKPRSPYSSPPTSPRASPLSSPRYSSPRYSSPSSSRLSAASSRNGNFGCRSCGCKPVDTKTLYASGNFGIRDEAETYGMSYRQPDYSGGLGSSSGSSGLYDVSNITAGGTSAMAGSSYLGNNAYSSGGVVSDFDDDDLYSGNAGLFNGRFGQRTGYGGAYSQGGYGGVTPLQMDATGEGGERPPDYAYSTSEDVIGDNDVVGQIAASFPDDYDFIDYGGYGELIDTQPDDVQSDDRVLDGLTYPLSNNDQTNVGGLRYPNGQSNINSSRYSNGQSNINGSRYSNGQSNINAQSNIDGLRYPNGQSNINGLRYSNGVGNRLNNTSTYNDDVDDLDITGSFGARGGLSSNGGGYAGAGYGPSNNTTDDYTPVTGGVGGADGGLIGSYGTYGYIGSERNNYADADADDQDLIDYYAGEDRSNRTNGETPQLKERLPTNFISSGLGYGEYTIEGLQDGPFGGSNRIPGLDLDEIDPYDTTSFGGRFRGRYNVSGGDFDSGTLTDYRGLSSRAASSTHPGYSSRTSITDSDYGISRGGGGYAGSTPSLGGSGGSEGGRGRVGAAGTGYGSGPTDNTGTYLGDSNGSMGDAGFGSGM